MNRGNSREEEEEVYNKDPKESRYPLGVEVEWAITNIKDSKRQRL